MGLLDIFRKREDEVVETPKEESATDMLLKAMLRGEKIDIIKYHEEPVEFIKSALLPAVAEEVNITDVRLLLFNPIDLRGIPVADQRRQFAVWLKPKIFKMNGTEDYVNILLLDEISAAPQSVQAAAYQITLDRKVGEHALPKNCIVIAAGNRVTDKSVAYQMPKALARLQFLINQQILV